MRAWGIKLMTMTWETPCLGWGIGVDIQITLRWWLKALSSLLPCIFPPLGLKTWINLFQRISSDRFYLWWWFWIHSTAVLKLGILQHSFRRRKRYRLLAGSLSRGFKWYFPKFVWSSDRKWHEENFSRSSFYTILTINYQPCLFLGLGCFLSSLICPRPLTQGCRDRWQSLTVFRPTSLRYSSSPAVILVLEDPKPLTTLHQWHLVF